MRRSKFYENVLTIPNPSILINYQIFRFSDITPVPILDHDCLVYRKRYRITHFIRHSEVNLFRRCEIVFQSTSPHMVICIHTRARSERCETKRGQQQRDISTNKATRFFCFLRRRLYISLREFKIEKEKRVQRKKIAQSSPRQSETAESAEPITFWRSNFFSHCFVSCRCSRMATEGRKQRFCDTANTRSFCHVDDNISSFFCSFLFFFSFLNHFSVSTSKLSFSSLPLYIFLFIYLFFSLSFSRQFTKLSIAMSLIKLDILFFLQGYVR